MLTIDGGFTGANFGASVATGGDVDGDGTPDLLVGAPESAIGGPETGSVELHSGASGALLRTYFGGSPGHRFGFAVAFLGDLDADGRDDYGAGGLDGNYVRIWSGATGHLIATIFGDASGDQFGSSLCGVGDVNADGVPDFAVGAPGSDLANSDAGLVRVFSGLDASVLYDVTGAGASSEFGYALARAGRVDGDAVEDFVVGSSTGSNFAEVRSGADGALIHAFVGDASIDWFGTAVAGVGDANGDGASDVLIGASQGLLGRGYARLYSGATGELLFNFGGGAPLDLFGWSVSPAGDVDGDGRADFAIGAPFSEGAGGAWINAGAVHVYSGRNGTLITTFYGTADDEALGWSVAGAPCANLVCGAPIAGTAGSARVFDTAQTPGWTTYCISAPNSVGPGAVMSALGSTSLAANQFTLVANGCPPNSSGIFYYGRVAAQTAFGNGYRCIGGATIRLPIQQASPSGVASRVLDLTALPSNGIISAGQVWRFQLWYRNPAGGGAGFNLSNGLRALFCP